MQIEMRYKLSCLLFSVLFLGLVACSSNKEEDQEPDVEFDESAMLINIADNVIVYNYKQLQESINLFETALSTYEEDSSGVNLKALQDGYVQLGEAWNKVSSYAFGPSVDVALAASFNTYPVDETLIEANVSSSNYNLNAVSNYVATGLNTLDYLLYSGVSLSSPRLIYLKSIVTQMKTNVSSVVGDWEGSYRDSFVNNTGTQNGSSVSTLLNALIQNFEVRYRNGKIRIPSGISNGNNIDTSRVEGLFSRVNSINFLLAAHQGVSDLYYGVGDPVNGTSLGLDDYLLSYDETVMGSDAKLTDQLTKEFNDVFTLANELNSRGTLIDLLMTELSSITSLHNEVQDIIGLLKVDVTSVLKVAITYNDTDGD